MHITEIQLLTNDLAAQRQFYGETLGLPVTDVAANEIAVKIGTTKVVFRETATPMEGSTHFAINIPENQFNEAKAWLKARTPLVTDKKGADEFHFSNKWNAHAVYFYDPSQNIVDLIARHDLPNRADTPFSVASWLEVSEIGVPSADVQVTAKAIQDSLDVPIYFGEGNNLYTAAGDEHGLFVIVKLGRVWHPETGLVANSDPVIVKGTTEKGRPFTLSSPPLRIT
jgi:catechol-2,3-dioxygenase